MKIIILNDDNTLVLEIGEKQLGKPLKEITEQVLYIIDEFVPISEELYDKITHYCD